MFSARRGLAVLCLLASCNASGEILPNVSLEAFTSPELARAIAGGKTTVLVPIGGTEQNGLYMVLGKHNVRAKALAERIAIQLGNALVAPVMAYVPEGGTNPPTAHMRFPGTITITEAAFESILESTAQSLRLAGFRDIVFLGDHGGYQPALQHAAQRLNREWSAAPARAYAITEYYRASESGFANALRARGYGAAEIGTHAGLADTSLALAVDPNLVRSDHLRTAPPPGDKDGVHGDPRRASTELGQVGVELVVADTVNAIRSAIAHR